MTDKKRVELTPDMVGKLRLAVERGDISAERIEGDKVQFKLTKLSPDAKII
jgi:hypothetical protein